MKTVKGILDLDRFEIPYRKYGNSDDMLMCVSGALQTMAIWHTVIRRFTDRFTVVIFDMPGVGRSKIKYGSVHITVQEQLESLHGLIKETHRGGELTLAASSWGTAIASAYASLRPELVQQMVLCSFGLKPNAVMQEIVRRAHLIYQRGDYASGAGLILDMFGGQIGESYKRQIIAQFEQLNKANAEAFCEHCSNILKMGRLDDAIDLTRIKARTLIVNGANDTIIDPEDMYVAQKLIPNCETRMVEGVGHFLHLERPEVLEDYAEFLFAAEPAAT
ncbi:MAG: alpha/beta hydrolase [Gammaproteobacteria bacterium]|nr:alpha/beta hydrolase [Gammaproteobacteria bacterium]